MAPRGITSGSRRKSVLSPHPADPGEHASYLFVRQSFPNRYSPRDSPEAQLTGIFMLDVASLSVSSGVSNNCKHDRAYSFQRSISVRCRLDQVGLWAFVLIVLNEVGRPSLKMGGPIPYIWVFECVKGIEQTVCRRASVHSSSALLSLLQAPAASACLP